MADVTGWSVTTGFNDVGRLPIISSGLSGVADITFAEIQHILAADGLFIDAAGEVRQVTGRLLRATDAGSDATWIAPEPYLAGNTLVKPAAMLWLDQLFRNRDFSFRN